MRDEEGAVTPVRHASVPVAVPADGTSEELVYEVGLPRGQQHSEIALALHDDLGGTTSFLRGETGR